MQYRTWKTYNCKFLVLAGYLRSFYQLLFVNFGFGSVSFPFNCHLKQYSNLVFSSGLHTCYIHTFFPLNPWIQSDPWIARCVFFLKDFGGVVVQRCAQNHVGFMRILSSFLIFTMGVGNLHLPAATIRRNATTMSRAAKRLHKECPACQHCRNVAWSW